MSADVPAAVTMPLSDFIDSYIVLVASRLGADPDADLVSKQSDVSVQTWSNVAVTTQHMLRGPPMCSKDRQAVKWVDTDRFTAKICQQRVRYVLWRAAKQRAERKLTLAAVAQHDEVEVGGAPPPPPSDFSILTHSMRQQVDAIMAEARARLPTTKGADDGASSKSESTDASGGSAVRIVQPPAHMLMDEAELRVRREMGEAEDDMLQQIQVLQQNFFTKYRKWVEVPLVEVSKLHTDGPADAPSGGVAKSGEHSSHRHTGKGKEETHRIGAAAAAPTSLSDFSTADVASLLGRLGLSEHQPKFKRTTGALLDALTKEEVTERFAGDAEARDILWHELQRVRALAGPCADFTSAAVAQPKAFSVAHQAGTDRKPTGSTRDQLHALLDALGSSGGRKADAPVPNGTERGRPSRAYRRPPRPSELRQDDDAEEREVLEMYGGGGDGGDLDAQTAAFLNAVRGSAGSAAEPPAASRAAPRHVDAAAASTGHRPSAAAAPPASSKAPPPSATRANRWQVVEYDDDDDDV